MPLLKWIYVGFKGEALDSEELMYIFRPFGDPMVGKIVGKHHAYVKFEHEESAARAAATMNGCVINSKGPIEVNIASSGRNQEFYGKKNGSTAKTSVAARISPPIPKAMPINSKELQASFEPITEDMVGQTHPFVLKDMLAVRLLPIIAFMYPELADQLTGMVVELDNDVVLKLLKDMNALKDKVQQAATVLCDFRDRKRASVAK